MGEGGNMKYILLGVDFVLFLVGGTMLGVGIWMAVDTDAVEAFAQTDLNQDLYWTSVYMMITIGCLVIIASILGALGAYSKSMKWALFAFIGILSLCLVMELVVIIITGVFWDSIDAGTQQEMIDEVKYEYIDEYAVNDSVSVKWNDMQIDWKCCGARDYNDYDASRYTSTYPTNQVPWTCCVMEVEGGRTLGDVLNVDNCRIDAAKDVAVLDHRSEWLHTRGCYSRLNDILSENSIILIALTIAFAALEVVGLVMAFMVMRD